MIVGLGLDLVALPRVERMLARWEDRILKRVMTDSERAGMPIGPRRVEYVAGRLAAKEAASKALGVPDGIAWHDAEVVPARPGPPQIRFHGVAHKRASELNVSRAFLTLTHDAGVAAAVVILEADRESAGP